MLFFVGGANCVSVNCACVLNLYLLFSCGMSDHYFDLRVRQQLLPWVNWYRNLIRIHIPPTIYYTYIYIHIRICIICGISLGAHTRFPCTWIKTSLDTQRSGRQGRAARVLWLRQGPEKRRDRPNQRAASAVFRESFETPCIYIYIYIHYVYTQCVFTQGERERKMMVVLCDCVLPFMSVWRIPSQHSPWYPRISAQSSVHLNIFAHLLQCHRAWACRLLQGLVLRVRRRANAFSN